MSRFRNTLAKVSQKVPLPTGVGSLGWNGSWQHRYDAGIDPQTARRVGDGSSSSLVVPCVDFISNGFIEAPVRLREQRGDDLITLPQHPLPMLVRRPNPFYSGALMWMATVADWIADGNTYWLPFESEAGAPVQLYWVPHWFIEPKGTRDGSAFLSHYEYRPGFGAMIALAPEQVIHFRWGLDPHNPLKGFSRLKSVLNELYGDAEAALFVATLLRNLGVPGLVVSPKGDSGLSPTEAELVKSDIVMKTTGSNRGDPLVMHKPTDVQMFGFSPEQLDMASIRAFPESRVPAALGLPSAVVGFLTGMQQTKVGATMAELRELGYESGVIPKMTLFAEELHTQLLPFYTTTPDKYVIDFDTTNVRVLQEDQNKAAARWKNVVGGPIAKRSEGRAALGLAVEAEDDMYYGQGGAAVAPVVPDPRAPQLSKITFAAATDEMLSFLRGIDGAAADEETRFAAQLTRAFDQLGADAETIAQKMRFALTPEDEAIVDEMLRQLKLSEFKVNTLAPLYEETYVISANDVFAEMRSSFGLGVATDLPDTIARKVVELGGRQLGLLDLTADTRSALFSALTDARKAGAGPIETSRLIRQYVPAGRFHRMEKRRAGSGVNYRSRMIARTEIKFAQNVSTGEAGRAAGFELFLCFDNRTGFGDGDCVARAGETFTYQQMVSESSAEHPNGTLSWSPVPGSQKQ